VNHTPQEWACLAAFAVGIPGLIVCAVAAAREGARAAAAHAAEQEQEVAR
jgi:hypothetical protein